MKWGRESGYRLVRWCPPYITMPISCHSCNRVKEWWRLGVKAAAWSERIVHMPSCVHNNTWWTLTSLCCSYPCHQLTLKAWHCVNLLSHLDSVGGFKPRFLAICSPYLEIVSRQPTGSSWMLSNRIHTSVLVANDDYWCITGGCQA